ncbi:Signal recognition particle receptor FtsY [hydrothermal vent metagenome]|uniref:Signal recognition particle receptor FtsY n=1 Tax=hydrothermal vent metagenome TaxID=652676 RepID=A0A3B0XYY5_9ZZZZ
MFGFLRRKKKNTEPDAAAKEELAQQPAELQSEADTDPTAVIETITEHGSEPDSTNETQHSIAAVSQADNSFDEPESRDTCQDSHTSVQNNDNAEAEESRKGMFHKLRERLSKTRAGLTDGMADLLLGKKNIDDDLLEELETRLLTADVGIEATTKIISDLTQRVSRKELNNPEALFQALCDDMLEILKPVDQPLIIDPQTSPFVILVIGINGAGKTTTIGKLAKRFQQQGKSVMLAAGDTFRAAAVEQLQTWGERNNIAVVAQGTGADSASVIYDAIESAKARNIDIVIADTAGRLHTQSNLMDELIKIKRVMGKLDDSAPHETLLVMDAGFGQNGLIQAQQFHKAMGLSGLVLTKLDGTAKGGILFAIAEKLGTPIRFIGVGEGIDDLREFHAGEFIDALLDKEMPEQPPSVVRH